VKTRARLNATVHPPLLSLSIFEAPHRRMHISAITALRQDLFDACVAAKITLPIDYPIDLSVLFVNPMSPDLGNLYLALEQALDGNTLSKRTAVLEDDALISKASISKMYTDPNKLDSHGRPRKKGHHVKKAS